MERVRTELLINVAIDVVSHALIIFMTADWARYYLKYRFEKKMFRQTLASYIDGQERKIEGNTYWACFLGYDQAPRSIQLDFVTPLENDTQ